MLGTQQKKKYPEKLENVIFEAKNQSLGGKKSEFLQFHHQNLPEAMIPWTQKNTCQGALVWREHGKILVFRLLWMFGLGA